MKSPSARGLVLGAVALIALLVGWRWLLPLLSRKPPPKPPPAIPVEVASAQRADMPVYLEGLGTVQAFYTVTVTARVDGQIQKIAFREGEEVKQGALLAQIDPRPFEAALGVAVATRDKDRAQLENARRDMERYRLLAPQELASKQTVDTQQALIAQLGAQLQGDEAAIDSARTQLDYTRIRSPISGRTGIRLVDPGNNVHASDTTGIVVVTQLQPIAVIFSLPEDEFTQLNDALQRGAVMVTALARENREPLDSGTVSLIDNQIDQNTGTIRVKAVLPNTRHRLWPGEFVSMQVLAQTRHDVLTIPASAVQRGPNGLFTYVVQPDSTIRVATLKAGEAQNGVVVVEQGLQDGDRVVASNQYRLQPGSRIRIAAPAMAGPAAPPGGPAP